LPYWFLPPTPTPPNAQIISTRSSQNTYPGLHVQSPGLLQLTALRCVRQFFIRRVQSVQNTAARLLTGAGRRDHISLVLRQLHWLPVQRRVDYKLACFVFSSLSGHAPPYLADDIHLVSESHRRSSTDRSCAVPRTHNTFGDRSFAVAGPCVGNSLPAHLRDEDITYGGFRRELKTFCFNVASGAQ